MNSKNNLQFGKWFIGGLDINLNGILNLTEESGVLELYSDEELPLPYKADVVYGKTYQGKAFTLYKCQIEGSTNSSIVHDYETKYIYKVHCDYILEDAIFNSEQEVLISEVYFSVTNLERWAFQNNVEVKSHDDYTRYSITTNKSDEILHKNEEFEFKISIYTYAGDYSYSTSSVSIKTYVRLELKFTKPTHLERIHSIIYQIRDFISLCTNLRTYIDYITAKPHYTNPDELQIPIKIYGNAIEFGDNKNIEELQNYHVYISLDNIKKDFNLCMKNWFEKNEKLRPVIDLYLSINYHRTSLERHFLNLVQALEAYHRLTRKNHVLPKEEHERKIQSIITNAPEQYQNWIKEKLNFSNEPSLHERLEELLTPKGKTEAHEIKYHHLFRLGKKDKVKIIRDIKNTRNYNTHFDERLKRKSLKGEELYQLILLLKLMIEYYLLMELEIDEDIVLDLSWRKSEKLSTRIAIIESTKSN
ncbi:HEPN domain-containing protein [Lysinibacillus halotolerans]|uniref:Uncharacterized protein n=1 Tax=Lysinibacillus halotolerans TaxID=1368476 RepID=A0A3M8H823_9BACI|nr:HEPN domain-containing protein [Lysinibacillus halotolerans]RNC98250.1 hypothetical protein EC501_11635 [Lysinibacillus halotolerans]